MIGILTDHDMGDRGLGGQAALDQTGRRGRLDDHALAGSAGVLGTAHDQHLELSWDDIEPLGAIFADEVKATRAAGAGLVLYIDEPLDPGQVLWERSPVSAPLAGGGGLARRITGLGVRGLVGLHLLDVFEGQLQLIDGQSLGPAAEAVPLHLLDDLT